MEETEETEKDTTESVPAQVLETVAEGYRLATAKQDADKLADVQQELEKTQAELKEAKEKE